MPIFEYRCRTCGATTEVLALPGQDEQPRCARCGSTQLEKVFSTFGVGIAGSSDSCGTGSCTTGTCSTGTCPY